MTSEKAASPAKAEEAVEAEVEEPPAAEPAPAPEHPQARLSAVDPTWRRSAQFSDMSFVRSKQEISDQSNTNAEGVVVHGGRGEVGRAKREAQRRRSMDQMIASSFDGGLALAMDDIAASGISAAASPQEKMDTVLTLAKEKGLTSQQIFKSFDFDGNGKIEPLEFKSGLMTLDKQRFTLTDDQILELVRIFDKNGDRLVDMSEFKCYCYALPGLAWKAERDRVTRERAARKAGVLEEAPPREEAEEEEEEEAPPSASTHLPAVVRRKRGSSQSSSHGTTPLSSARLLATNSLQVLHGPAEPTAAAHKPPDRRSLDSRFPSAQNPQVPARLAQRAIPTQRAKTPPGMEKHLARLGRLDKKASASSAIATTTDASSSTSLFQEAAHHTAAPNKPTSSRSLGAWRAPAPATATTTGV